MGIGGYVVVTVGILLLCYFVPALVRRRQALISSHVHDRVSPHMQVLGRLDQIMDTGDPAVTMHNELPTRTRLLANKQETSSQTAVMYQRLPRVSANRTVQYAPRYEVEKTVQLGMASRAKLRAIMAQIQHAYARYSFARTMRRVIASLVIVAATALAVTAYLALLPWWMPVIGVCWLGWLYWRGRRAKRNFMSYQQKTILFLQLVASGKLEHKLRVQALAKQGAKAQLAASHVLSTESKLAEHDLSGKQVEVASLAVNEISAREVTGGVLADDLAADETALINVAAESGRAWEPVKVPAPLYTLQKTQVVHTYIPYVAEEHLAANEQADAEVAENGKAPQRPKSLSAYYQQRAAEFEALQAQQSEQIVDNSAGFAIDLEDILAKRRASA